MVFGLPFISSNLKVCEGCIYGKMHRLPFPKTSWRAKALLQLVHANIWGPSSTPCFGGRRYFLLFIDDYTRMMWVYFIQQKSDAFSCFKEFKALVEKQSGYSLKILRTDRGGEFNGHIFINFCNDHGIKKELTVRHTPQQNGVVERKNKTIVEMARSMLQHKNLPKNLWAEAVSTTIYILNCSPTKAVLNMTPYEAWFNRKPTVHHFKVFGCVAYSHIQKENREKLNEKEEKCIFVSYSDQSKGYRLFKSDSKQLIILRDVIFDEEASWQLSTEANETQEVTNPSPCTLPPSPTQHDQQHQQEEVEEVPQQQL